LALGGARWKHALERRAPRRARSSMDNDFALEIHPQEELERRLATAEESENAAYGNESFAVISASGFAVISATGFAVI
jgi:hypothetical protein